MNDKEKIEALSNLLTIAIGALSEHGDEGTLPYLEEKLKEITE